MSPTVCSMGATGHGNGDDWRQNQMGGAESTDGKVFYPSSICTDENDCAYVADFGQNKIHVLSTTDGAVIKRFNVKYYDLFDLFAVRFHDQHLFVEHKIPGSKYAISKFKESD